MSSIIIPFIGGLAMFIYGMNIMADGLQNAAGSCLAWRCHLDAASSIRAHLCTLSGIAGTSYYAMEKQARGVRSWH